MEQHRESTQKLTLGEHRGEANSGDDRRWQTEKSKVERQESEEPLWSAVKWGREVKGPEDWETLYDVAGSHWEIWKDDFSVNGIEANVSDHGQSE